MFSVIRLFILLRFGKTNFSPVISSYNKMYLAESSATRSSGASGKTQTRREEALARYGQDIASA